MPSSSSSLDSLVSPERLGQQNRPVSICPRKKSLYVLAMKSWWRLTPISLIVGAPQGILDQLPRPHPVHLPNLIIILLISYIIIYWPECYYAECRCALEKIVQQQEKKILGNKSWGKRIKSDKFHFDWSLKFNFCEKRTFWCSVGTGFYVLCLSHSHNFFPV